MVVRPEVKLKRPDMESYLPFLLDKYTNCKIKPSFESILELSKKFYEIHKARYDHICDRVSIPSEMIFAIHWKEASGNFRTCLHNGDKLPGPTHRVPKGRGPFKDWEDAAVDALRFSNIGIFAPWSVERMLFACEAYNGWGYHTGSGRNTTPECSSPYLWAGTDGHLKGMYVGDGRFNPNATSKNPGVAAIFRTLGVS